MSLLREIEEGATDAAVDLSTVLRKAKILAARLKNRDLADWVDRELNGYPVEIDVPEYRIAQGTAHGDFALTFQRMGTAPIPGSVLPKELRYWAEGVQLRAPIATYATLVDNSKKDASTIRFPWPTDMARIYGSKAYEEALCLDAWLAVDPSTLAGLLDSVRNRLLSLALAIEMENPDAGEADIRSTPVEPARVAQLVQTIIHGGTNIVAAGGSGFTQQQYVSVQPGDFASLRKNLETAGAQGCEIKELESELVCAQTPDEKQRVADSWLGRTARNAIAATRAFAVEVSAKAIAEYLRPGP